MRSAGLDALVVNPSPSLTYLTGLHFHLSERPVVAIFSADNPPAIVLPEMELGKLSSLSYETVAFPYDEDLSSWKQAFGRAADACGMNGKTVGVEPRGLRVLELRFLEDAAPEASYVSGESVLADLRMRKDAAEIETMRQAVDVAQRALDETLKAIRTGITERELASELTLQLLRNGSDAEFPFQPIVAFGPNSANPHAVPSSRALQEGDLVLIDWGAGVDGYYSDLTRVFTHGNVEDELQKIAAIVAEANRAGCAAGGPGVPAGEVDKAARRVIDEAGYGNFFIHRTGHGLGMEAHEEPYIRGDNQVKLEPGMTFTVEPGIYLPGQGGVRIEDDVVVTPEGPRVLTSGVPKKVAEIEALMRG